MKQKFILLMLLVLLLQMAQAQKNPDRLHQYHNFPLVVGVQFHSLSHPFKNLQQNFRNIGFTVGSEIALGSTHKWAQSFQLGWYRNKSAGNGLMVYTQSVYRPYLVGNAFAEVKAGFGWLWQARPSDGLKPVNGNWVNVGKTSKGMLMIPAGVSVGYNSYKNGTYVAPTISYQVFVSGIYNQSFPVMVNSLIQAGTRVHFNNNKN
ncbi:MAG: hypothetical protein H7Z13_14475 [Ferruginibacter sp.]|nr:hypothetical protein [Ferruginibacter sp.]